MRRPMAWWIALAIAACKAQESEVVQRVLGRNRDDRDIELVPNNLGEVSARNALLGYRVKRCAGGCCLDRQPARSSDLKPVGRGPAWRPVADVALHPCRERHLPGWDR